MKSYESAARQPALGRILVVDDDATVRKIYSETLTGHGYDVAAVVSGKQAMEQLGESRPDLIVLDIMMPDMNGLEFLEELQSDPALAGIQVMVSSGYAILRERALSLGAVCCLDKSTTPEDFVRLVRQHCRAPAAAQA